MNLPRRLTIRQPDDWHAHLRDGAMLKAVLPYTERVFGRAIIMPNLAPPITDAAAADAYKARILAARAPDSSFQPLMTCYLTDHTDADALAAGFSAGSFVAAKLYPARATTNSAHGVTDIPALTPVLARMAEIGMPLLIHGEVTDPEIDIFDREAVFIDNILIPLRQSLPGLKIVFEHITTREAAQYVAEAGANVAATITPHHLLLNRNALFAGGIRPHAYCLPVAKREHHRQALCEVVASGHPQFFLGTDTAPHRLDTKEADCGCAGIFCAPTALESYAEIFDRLGALQHFEGFASLNGPRFYGLPVNEHRITLEACPDDTSTEPVPTLLAEAVGGIKPFRAGETLRWRIATAAES